MHKQHVITINTTNSQTHFNMSSLIITHLHSIHFHMNDHYRQRWLNHLSIIIPLSFISPLQSIIISFFTISHFNKLINTFFTNHSFIYQTIISLPLSTLHDLTHLTPYLIHHHFIILHNHNHTILFIHSILIIIPHHISSSYQLLRSLSYMNYLLLLWCSIHHLTSFTLSMSLSHSLSHYTT